MNRNQNALPRAVEYEFDESVKLSATEQIIEFYDEATIDYEHWSKNCNMHLGFYRWGINPFDREKMLEQLNLEIGARLEINPNEKTVLIDLGCGVGAVSRTIAKNYSKTEIKGVTLVQSQIETGTKLNIEANLHRQIELLSGDYSALPFADGFADGAWAVESACYANGADKENLVIEMARVLKKGGRFLIADCFIKQPEKEFNFLCKRLYPAICRNWILPEMFGLNCFVATLEKHGFQDILVEDISWRVAPSVAHAPFAIFSFIIKKFLAGEKLKPQSIKNLKASLLTVPLGLNRAKFSYCLISGKRG